MEEFRFEKETHAYFLGDRKLPSVTQCFEEWIQLPDGDWYNLITKQIINKHIFERARNFGNALHLAFFYMFRHGLDWSTLHYRLVEPMKKIKEWSEEYGVEVLYVEEPMYSKKHQIAGTPDLICTFKNDRKILNVVDLKKKGAGLLVRVQLKAYEMIFREWKNYFGGINHWSLKVDREGNLQFIKELIRKNDWNFFLACLYKYNYLTKFK
jgi:hypothetical protein